MTTEIKFLIIGIVLLVLLVGVIIVSNKKTEQHTEIYHDKKEEIIDHELTSNNKNPISIFEMLKQVKQNKINGKKK